MWATKMNIISLQVLVRQENHKYNGDDTRTSNQKNTTIEKSFKLQPLTLTCHLALTPNPKLELDLLKKLVQLQFFEALKK
jgi:hypothetical protein